MKTKLSILRALQTLSKINFDELFRRVRDRLNAKHKSGPRWTLIVFALLCSAAIAIPAMFDIGWELRPASEGTPGYNIYLGPTNALVRLGYVGVTNKATITLPDGVYQIRVTAVNPIEEGPLSLPLYVIVTEVTNVVAITKGPGAPLNVQLR